MDKYDVILDAALLAIENAPHKGRKHPKLRREFRYYYAQRHYIVYRIVGNTVEVVRILHDQLDIARHIY